MAYYVAQSVGVPNKLNSKSLLSKTAGVSRHTDFNVPIFAYDIFVIIAELQN